METVEQLFTWHLVQFTITSTYVKYTSCGNLSLKITSKWTHGPVVASKVNVLHRC